MASLATTEERRDALVERLFEATLGTFDLLTVYLGDRLGLYRALAEDGRTPGELAGAAGIHERYAREWLEQQAMSGIVEVDDPDADPGDRRYSLPEGHEEPLLGETSLSYIAPIAQAVVACVRPIDALLDAFRSGDGVPYADYGADLHEGQARFTRPLFENLLATEWLPAVPDVHERLRDDPPARVADVACGLGRSSIEIARGYPKVTVDGIDLDGASIDRARELLPGSGVEDRVTFHHADAADPGFARHYDLVTVFEALHDMSRPVEVLRTLRGLLAEGGSVIVGDERTAERFSLDAGPVERLYYGFSVLHCLPVGMVGEDPAGTGTVMRESTVRGYAEEAGFAGFEVLAIKNDFWRFYRLSG
ncbi:MAG: class I SAM-dependent methyltransferase [Verrucomicrobiota bacterium]